MPHLHAAANGLDATLRAALAQPAAVLVAATDVLFALPLPSSYDHRDSYYYAYEQNSRPNGDAVVPHKLRLPHLQHALGARTVRYISVRALLVATNRLVVRIHKVHPVADWQALPGAGVVPLALIEALVLPGVIVQTGATLVYTLSGLIVSVQIPALALLCAVFLLCAV